jgi:hypothetical protein
MKQAPASKKPSPAPERPVRRITGLETEYGCLVETGQKVHEILPRVRDWIFNEGGFGLVDQHQRDWDEPSGNGGFLYNGGRLYIDMGHIEYCTPECLTLKGLVRYDRAGDVMLERAVEALGLTGQVSFIRNNIDHYSASTFGCHENYSLQRYAPFTERNVLSLLAFLTLRLLLCGSGCMGTLRSRTQGRGESREGNIFQISQRADFIQNDFYEWVQQNRAIINTRDEPLADPNRFRRLHLLHGDTNVLPATLFLKAGCTRLVLELLELDALPGVELADATLALRRLSRQVAPPWMVELESGEEADALELLGLYLQKARENFAGRDAETDQVLELWARTQDGLAKDRARLVGVIDWVTKEYLFEQFRASEGIDWGHPWLESQDLEFHHIGPERSLGLALADNAGPWAVDPAALEEALTHPPADTRAAARGRVMARIRAENLPYMLDWDAVSILTERTWFLRDPFCTELHDFVDETEDDEGDEFPG